ncbi:MAG: hypothetical protein AB7K09_23105, partial [Planctomycetota bacterium]
RQSTRLARLLNDANCHDERPDAIFIGHFRHGFFDAANGLLVSRLVECQRAAEAVGCGVRVRVRATRNGDSVIVVRPADDECGAVFTSWEPIHDARAVVWLAVRYGDATPGENRLAMHAGEADDVSALTALREAQRR